MLRPLIRATLSQNYIVFFMRFVIIAGLALAVFIGRGPLTPPFPEGRYYDITLAIAVSVVVNILFGLVVSVPLLRGNAPYMYILGDWVMAGIFSALVTQNPLMVVGILMVLIVQGIFRLGTEWGIIDAVGIVLASASSFVLERAIDTSDVQVLIFVYVPIIILLALMIFVCVVWYNAFDENNSLKNRRLIAMVEDSKMRLENMRERAKALADMGALLNSTLDYEKILDACLDIGRISIRANPKQRLIAMVLVVESDDEMSIANARGLQHLDLARRFRGHEGVIAQAISEARTIITGEGGQNDPELGKLIAFGNIESVLVIPLRVEFTTYGVLVFASTAQNAFNEDHVDTMQSLGIQATIALKNAVIVDTLQAEKDRLIRIERGMREALTRDLHDIPTQTMSVLSMQLGMLPTIARQSPEKLREEVDNLRNIATRFVEEMRYVMFTWRPLSLESAGLTMSLEQLANKMQQTYKQPMTCQVDPNAVQYLTSEQQTTLFYLIEEAANNARKHAQAPMIKVKVSLEQSSVVVRIMDNGKGFDVNKMTVGYETRSSYGMINMSDRAESIQGTLDVRSEPGKGTTISVRIPVQLKDKQAPVKQATRKSFERPQERPYSGPMSPLS